MITIAATIVVLSSVWVEPEDGSIRRSSGIFSSIERCEEEAKRVTAIVRKASSDAVMSCGTLRVSDELRARVEAFEAGTLTAPQNNPDHQRGRRDGLVL